jgi:nitroreductase
MEMMMSDFMDVILKRRSIRKFTEQSVEKEKLILLLEAAMAAPTAMNAQPWEFVVITDEEVMDRFRNTLMFAKMNAPAAICVLGSSRRQKNKAGEKFWVQDCSAATENILLAATALGLGSVWIGIHPVTLFKRQVSEILNLPEGVTPLNLIYIGYPAEEKEPRTQYEDERVHWGPFPTSEQVKPNRLNLREGIIFTKGDHDDH